MIIQKEALLRYLKRRVSEIDELKAGLSKMDYELLFNIGHKLKGNGKTFGFSDISDIGDSIEKAAIKKDRFKLEEYINRLEIGVLNKLKVLSN